MKGLITIVFFQLSMSAVYCQMISLQVVILDSLTGLPAPYTTIELVGKGGVVCDEKGACEMSIGPEELSSDLSVSNLGYNSKLVRAERLLTADTIFLAPTIYEIGEVVVTGSAAKTSIEKGVLNAESDASYGMNDWMQIVLWLEKSSTVDEKLQSVSFYIEKTKKKKAPFRVRVYGVDANGKPGEDLLYASKVVQAQQPGWLKVELGSEQIAIPASGIFVAMEWINSGKKYQYDERIGDRKVKLYGQKLGAVIYGAEPKTWIKLVGKEWRKDDRHRGYGYRNAMIKADIQPAS